MYSENEYVEKMTRLFDENDVEMTVVKSKGDVYTSSSATVDGHELNSFEMLYIASLAIVTLAADVIAEAGPEFNGELYPYKLGAMIAGGIKERIHDSERGA